MVRWSSPVLSSMNYIYKPSFHVGLRMKENGYAIRSFDVPEETDIQGIFVKTYYNSTKRHEVKEAMQECNKIE